MPATTLFRAGLLGLLLHGATGCEADPGRYLKGNWTGGCTIDGQSFDIVLDEVKEPANKEATGLEGDWLFYDGYAEVSNAEYGETGAVLTLVAQCISEGGCNNQGDPYDFEVTMFDIGADNTTYPSPIRLKSTPTADDPNIQKGPCYFLDSVGTGTLERERLSHL